MGRSDVTMTHKCRLGCPSTASTKWAGMTIENSSACTWYSTWYSIGYSIVYSIGYITWCSTWYSTWFSTVYKSTVIM